MSNESVIKDLLQTLKDGQDGYAKAAETLEKDGNPDLSTALRSFGEQRGTQYDELKAIATQLGLDVASGGSALATAHRGWMAVKDAVTGSDADSVLGNADRGDDHAISEFEKALADDDLAPQARPVVTKQLDDIKRVQSEIRVFRRSLPA